MPDAASIVTLPGPSSKAPSRVRRQRILTVTDGSRIRLRQAFLKIL